MSRSRPPAPVPIEEPATAGIADPAIAKKRRRYYTDENGDRYFINERGGRQYPLTAADIAKVNAVIAMCEAEEAARVEEAAREARAKKARGPALVIPFPIAGRT
jgi:hypothetical protein